MYKLVQRKRKFFRTYRVVPTRPVAKATVINLKDNKYEKLYHEYKKDDDMVYIGRDMGYYGLKDIGWGNPFKLKAGEPRGATIERYRKYILGNRELLNRLPELAGKKLACWCKPAPCHGDILADLVNNHMVGVKRELVPIQFSKHWHNRTKRRWATK